MNPLYTDYARVAFSLMAFSVPAQEALQRAADRLLEQGRPIIQVAAARAEVETKLASWSKP